MNLKRISHCIAYFLLFSVGIYNALLESLRLGYINSDTVDTLMLWYGFQEHGWNFIKTWLSTQDNWLLSLLPFHALMFSIFPFSPLLIVLSGLCIFLLNVFLCGLIAYTIGFKKSAWLVPLLLLYSGDYFYQNSNFTFPITHNITNFFGLLAYLFAIRWIQNSHKTALCIIFFTIIVGAISDPWFLASYGLPLLMATFFIKKNKALIQASKIYSYLLIVIIAALTFSITRGFGLFYFLGGTSFQIANGQQFIHNALSIINNFGLFINFFPVNSHWAALVSLSILLLLAGLIIAKVKPLILPPSHQFFFLTIACSFMILTISFLLYAEPELYYLMNFYMMIILVICVGIEFNWHSFPQWMKRVQYILLAMYLISSVSIQLPSWKHPLALPVGENEDMLSLLIKQGLSYGYANYWSANVITGLSHNLIRVRPVSFSKENGYMFWDKRKQTSPFWYLPSDIPVGQKKFFVYWQPMKGLKDMKFYQQGLIKQYGQPIQTVPYKKGFIMIWSHPLKVGLKKDILPSWENTLPNLIFLTIM